MKKYLLVALGSLISGCASIGDGQLTMTFDSEVRAGIVRQDVDNALLGRLPITVHYEVSQMPVDAQGCFRVSGIHIEWDSGYKTSTPKVIRLCEGAGHYEYEVLYQSPLYAARLHDERFAQSVNPPSQNAYGEPTPPSDEDSLIGALLLGASVYQAIQGFYGTTPQSPNAPIQTPASAPVQTSYAGSCFSDYDCEYGQHCTKPLFALEGVCTQPVNEYGIPQIMNPRPNSYEIRTEPACLTDLECAIGARCSQALNACVSIY